MRDVWGARESRALVSAWRRNNFVSSVASSARNESPNKVREPETVSSDMRDARTQAGKLWATQAAS